MKMLLVCLFIIMPVHAIEQDKVMHFAASAVIGAGSQHYFKDYRYSLLVCLPIGAIKELTDERIDKYDLFYNGLGCLTGIFAYRAADYIINIKPIDHGAQVNLQFKF